MKHLFTFFFIILITALYSQNFHLVKDLTPGSEGSELDPVYAFEGQALFLKELGDDFFDFYITDGSESGTVKVSQQPIKFANEFGTLAETPDFIFLTIYDGSTDYASIYRYSKLSKELDLIAELTLSREIRNMGYYNGQIYFTSSDEFYHLDPSDGDYDLIKKFGDDIISNLVLYKDKIFFMAGSAQGYGLYESDGTEGGTKFIKVLTENLNESIDINSNLGISGDMLFMNVTYSYQELDAIIYSSDGTSEGTMLIIKVQNYNSNIRFYELGNKTIFNGKNVDGSGPNTLLVSDGTAAGTNVIDENFELDFYSELIPFKNKLYFTNASTLYSTDGNTITVALPDPIFLPVGVFNDSLYLINQDVNFSVTDGQSIGSNKPYALNALFGITNNKLFFGTDDGIHGSEIWVAEIGSVSTKKLGKLNEVEVWPNPAENTVMFNFGNKIENAEIIVYNTLGVAVINKHIYKNLFDVSSLQPGSYFLKINSGNKSYSAKLVKI